MPQAYGYTNNHQYFICVPHAFYRPQKGFKAARTERKI